jgi:hypothetical protein
VHVSENDWKLYLEETNQNLKAITFEYSDRKVVAVPESWTTGYSKWLETRCIDQGYFGEYSDENPQSNRQIIPHYDLSFDATRLPEKRKKRGSFLGLFIVGLGQFRMAR